MLGLVLPRLSDHSALKFADHHFGAVLRELADRGFDEFAQRLTGISGPPVQRLQPARGDARGREHGEDPELDARDHLPVGAPVSDPLECALKRQPQGDAVGLGVLIALPAPDVLLQCGPLEHVEVGRQSVLVALHRRRGLRDRDRPDGHVRPAGARPVRQPCRGHQDPHTLPAGNEPDQVIGVLDVVEDDEAIRPLRRGQRGQAAPRDHLTGGAVLNPHTELQSQLGETGEDRLARTRGDPGHERPVLLLAAGRHGGGQLRLPAAAHAREHRAPRRP